MTVTRTTDPAEPTSPALQIKNVSDEDVVGYAIDLTTIWGGGSSRSTGTMKVDLVYSLPTVGRTDAANVSKYEHLGPLRPGQEMLRVIGGAQLDPTGPSYIATVRAVVFADNTGIGDPAQIEPFFTTHADAAGYLESELRGLQIDKRTGVRDELEKWRNNFIIRDTSQQTGQQRPETQGLTIARRMIADVASRISELRGQTEDRLSLWYAEHYSYLQDLATALRQHSVMEGVIR